MKLFQIHRSQWFELPIDEVWGFFSSPTNLRRITPDYMGFEILSGLPDQMHPGMIIDYIVRPVAGIPIRWVTEITQFKPPFFFVDEQRFGPYAFWHHQHHFRESESGTKVTDIVNYALPFGSLGRLVHRVFVRKKLNEIFDYREEVLEQLLNESMFLRA